MRKRSKTKKMARTFRTFSPMEVIVKALQDQGKKISEMEEKLKDVLSSANSIRVSPQQMPYVFVNERPMPPDFYPPFYGLVDPICIACGAEYWSHSHEHGLCPECSKRYPWLL